MSVGRKQKSEREKGNTKLSVFMCVCRKNAKEGVLALASLLIHCKCPFDICIFADELESSQKEAFYMWASETVEIQVIDGRAYDRKGIKQEWYGLFYLPELTNDYEKVLVLSPEVIVCEDITGLWNVNLNHHALAAAKYLFNQLAYRQVYSAAGKETGVDEYVNSAVMLVNRKNFEKGKIRLTNAVTRDAAINRAFTKKILTISPKWNCPFEPLFADTRNEMLIPRDQILYDENRMRPMIMNYEGIHKPWSYPEYSESRYYFDSVGYASEQKHAHAFFPFTILTTAYNCGKYLTKYFESLIRQSIGFEENIQVILIDDGSDDDTEQVCKTYLKQYPNNIHYKKQKHSGILAGRNQALCLAETFGISCGAREYLYFLDADDSVTEDFFEKADAAMHAMEDIAVFAVPVSYVDGERETRLRQQYGREPFCRLNLNTDYGIGMNNLSSFIFPKTEHPLFDETVNPREAEIEFIRKRLKKEQEIGWINDVRLFARVREDRDHFLWSLFAEPDQMQHYYQEFWQKMMQEEQEERKQIPYYIQYSFIEEIVCFLSRNSQSNQFWNVIRPVLGMIEDTVIMDALGMHDMSRILFVLEKKYEQPPVLRSMDQDVELICGDTAVGRASYQSILLHFVKIENGDLIIEGQSSVPMCFGKESALVTVEINGRMDHTDMIKRNADKYLLGECYEYGTTFFYKYPLHRDEPLKLRFAYQAGEKKVCYHSIIGLRFSPVACEVPEQYAVRDRYALYLQGDSLYCIPVDETGKEKFETRYRESLKRIGDLEAIRAFRFRKHFFELRKRKEKQIWLFFDRIDKADDNGEAMFRYVMEQELPDVDAYFVIGKDCSDYDRLKKIGKVIPANSMRHRLLFSMADYVLTSQANGFVENPFGKGEKYYRDLLHIPKVIFLQHGITKDDQTRWLNRFEQDFTAFVTSSQREAESILSEPYYYKESQIWLTGMPRFDRLYHAEKKYILIMPTWRKNLMEQRWNEQKGVYRWEPYDGFRESKYCKKYSSLLQNQKLRTACRHYGYTLVFMTHPIMQPYQNLFDIPEEIQTFSYETSWRELFAWSDLMVTDYSSVAFDFAYLRKPIVYYQFDRDTFFQGHTYSEGYFHYDEDGFGEVVSEEESLVELLEQYMQKSCKLKPLYEDRIDQFYKYKDTENCARILECMMKI